MGALTLVRITSLRFFEYGVDLVERTKKLLSAHAMGDRYHFHVLPNHSLEHPLAQIREVNNALYETLGERWYTAFDDPIALLRAENRVKAPWMLEQMRQRGFPHARVLDVGCGGGFLSNELARHGQRVTGIDLSPDSLRVARQYDESGTVNYVQADAAHLPWDTGSFDVVSAMDFLEHVEEPAAIIRECGRVLRPGGLFFFHTFNRNVLAELVIIKMVEWLVANTPKDMHILRLFIKPCELRDFCQKAGMTVEEMTGIRPVLSSIPLKSLCSGRVPQSMRFTLTRSLLLSYMGIAVKS